MISETKYLKDCLKEAAECDRLAHLARSKVARKIMELSAAVWRNRARKEAKEKPRH
jgi:hypothetical protein